jgi:hypothetical protein
LARFLFRSERGIKPFLPLGLAFSAFVPSILRQLNFWQKKDRTNRTLSGELVGMQSAEANHLVNATE